MIIDKSTYYQFVDICNSLDAFYYKDFKYYDQRFRVFNYRLPVYHDWLVSRSAVELRGLLVEIDDNGNLIKIASRPPRKIFHLNENRLSQRVPLIHPSLVSDMLDGTLIMTFLYRKNGKLYVGLKSKVNIQSKQITKSIQWMNNHPDLWAHVKQIAEQNCTVYFEYCGPDNKIILPYKQPSLTVLGVRDNITGHEYTKQDFPQLQHYWVNQQIVEESVGFVQSVPDMTGIQGFVVQCDKHKFKIKTAEYVNLDTAKKAIHSERLLYQLCVRDRVNQVKPFFRHNKKAIRIINKMEEKTQQIYSHVIDKSCIFYERYRKKKINKYIELGHQQLDKIQFHVAINLYRYDSINDFRVPMLRWYKNYGIPDDVEPDE